MESGDDLQFLSFNLPGVVIYALGPCGAGKGTQIHLLHQMLPMVKFRHLSPGEEFRRLQQLGGPLAEEVRSYTDRGQLVPFDILKREVICPFINSLAEEEVAVIDGCPREENQTSVSDLLADRRQLAVIFEMSDEVCFRRLSHGKRGRSDDDFKTIRDRLMIYRRNLPGVKRGLSKCHVPCLIINGEPLPEETVKGFVRSLAFGIEAISGLRRHCQDDYHLAAVG